MSRVKENFLEEERIKLERAEAAYFALPEAQAKALEGIEDLLKSHSDLVEQNSALRTELAALQADFRVQTAPIAKWKERGIGFFLGFAASVVASLVWWRITKQWPVFG